MPETPPEGTLKVGRKLYLFTDHAGRAENLLITSHGGYFARPEFGKQTGRGKNIPGLGGWLEVPEWTTLYFYGPHKAVLQDPSIAKVFAGMKYLEQVPAGDKVRNYRLSKYQGKHGNKEETYLTIQGDIERNRNFISMRDDAILNPEITLDWIIKHCGKPFPKFDVLTVRARYSVLMAMGITVRDVLKQLEDKDYKYRHIHCVFCRSRILGPSRDHDPTTN